MKHTTIFLMLLSFSVGIAEEASAVPPEVAAGHFKIKVIYSGPDMLVAKIAIVKLKSIEMTHENQREFVKMQLFVSAREVISCNYTYHYTGELNPIRAEGKDNNYEIFSTILLATPTENKKFNSEYNLSISAFGNNVIVKVLRN